MTEEVVFRVHIKDLKVTDLVSRNRFKDKLRLLCFFDDKSFKTKKELISGSGEIEWKYQWKHEYKLFSWRYLEERKFKIQCVREGKQLVGSISIDLYTLATGTVEHNLPLLDVSYWGFFRELGQFPILI